MTYRSHHNGKSRGAAHVLIEYRSLLAATEIDLQTRLPRVLSSEIPDRPPPSIPSESPPPPDDSPPGTSTSTPLPPPLLHHAMSHGNGLQNLSMSWSVRLILGGGDKMIQLPKIGGVVVIEKRFLKRPNYRLPAKMCYSNSLWSVHFRLFTCTPTCILAIYHSVQVISDFTAHLVPVSLFPTLLLLLLLFSFAFSSRLHIWFRHWFAFLNEHILRSSFSKKTMLICQLWRKANVYKYMQSLLKMADAYLDVQIANC